MKIKNRLSLYFSLITGGLLLFVLAAIYFAFRGAMRHDFYERLKERSVVVASLYLDADEMSPSVLDGMRNKLLQKIPGEVYRIYNLEGKAVFVSDSPKYWGRSLIAEIRQKEYIEYREGKRQVVGRLYRDNQGAFVVITSAIDEGTTQRLSILLRIMAVVFVTVILLMYYSGRFLAERLLSPIDKLIARMQIISASNLHMRVETSGKKDEISILAENFNSLLERLENSFTLQGTFVANVTHELRSPVTSIIGETEVALMQERPAEEYRRILRSVLADSVRLKETISAMLELARVNNDFGKTPISSVRIDELLWELRDYWVETAGAESLILDLEELPEDESVLSVTGNKNLLYIALNNVIGNAFKFSAGKTVKCRFRSGEGLIRIEITDQGRGVGRGEFRKILDPFYRSEAASEFAGSGMGLYIANRIVLMLHGNLEVAESSSEGTTIAVVLPVS